MCKKCELLLFFIFILTTNISASEILFLSRETDTKWSLTPYYVNKRTLGAGGGGNIIWNLNMQGTVIQPSVKTGNRTNLYAKLGIGDVSRSINAKNEVSESGNFGDNFIYGLGLDWKIKKETPGFPLLNLNFGFTGYRTNFKSTIWYEPDGTRHEKIKTGTTNLYGFQTALMASKKVSKYVTLSVGGQTGAVTEGDYEEYLFFYRKSEGPPREEFVRNPNNPDLRLSKAYFIPYDEYIADEEYYLKKYPGCALDQYPWYEYEGGGSTEFTLFQIQMPRYLLKPNYQMVVQ